MAYIPQCRRRTQPLDNANFVQPHTTMEIMSAMTTGVFVDLAVCLKDGAYNARQWVRCFVKSAQIESGNKGADGRFSNWNLTIDVVAVGCKDGCCWSKSRSALHETVFVRLRPETDETDLPASLRSDSTEKGEMCRTKGWDSL